LLLGAMSDARVSNEEKPVLLGSQKNPIAVSDASIDRGHALYARHCASCHGPSGRGDGSAGRDLDPQPSNLCSPEVDAKSDLQLFRQITRGRRPMPSFSRLLSEEDRWHVVNFIRSLPRADAGGH
jgi:mono/diheme cytochrome c family protein